ncbi:MAG: cytochrome b/b6 domain-containing protein [Pseudomonadales bacterium]|nr:cytochrome b/b6 domain-containing protein [Pseudomonadales bacterium]
MKKIVVWDLPVRLFHWALVILVCFSFYSGLTGGLTLMDYHMLSGYTILTLLVFRVGWGLIGTRWARFSSFLYSPRKLIDTARHLFSRETEPYIGHNPLGGLSVLAMILALLVQAITGLFANDDILVEGPLRHLVSESTSNWLTEVHEINLWVIVALAILHMSAVLLYEFHKGQRLIFSMITGRKFVADDATGVNNRIIPALILLALAASLVYLVVNEL